MKQLLNKTGERIRRAWAGAKALLTRIQFGKWGCYAALALLLILLGSASYAYRTRREGDYAALQPLPKSVAALQVPEPTPEPTPVPARWVWPLEGEIVGAFSPNEPVWSATLGQWQTHPGLDIAGCPGEAVYACADGTVQDAWNDRLWGNVIVIGHPDGYQSTYAGVNTLKLAEPGSAVVAGQVISAVGGADAIACEAGMAAHIHFELALDGRPVDIGTLIDDPTD